MSSSPTTIGEPIIINYFVSSTAPYRCLTCNHAFYITPIHATSPTLSCPRCFPHVDDFDFNDDDEDFGDHRYYEDDDYFTNNSTSAVDSFLSSLPVVVPNPNSICSICMGDFSIDDGVGGRVVVELPCKHCFDEECIGEWIKRRNTCPMCRFKLPLGGFHKLDRIRDWELPSSFSLSAMLDEDGDTLMVDAV